LENCLRSCRQLRDVHIPIASAATTRTLFGNMFLWPFLRRLACDCRCGGGGFVGR
jgi:hypothetical protein